MSDTPLTLNGEYENFLRDLKTRIQAAQTRAALAVSKELISLYWQIGCDITERQEQQGWGDGILQRIADDIKADFPGVQGFSRRNLYRMRGFYQAYRSLGEFVPQLAAQIPWFHNVIILEKIKDAQTRFWYAQQTIANGWSRSVLEMHIESRLHERQGKAVANFERTLPAPLSDLAREMLKDPYHFDFLTLHDAAVERDLERGLITHVRQFLLELGSGFAFVGSQYPLSVGDEDFYIDLLFYHLKLRFYVVIDLKMRAFKPEDAGKMNFYLSVVDDTLRHESDAPTIGIVLCKTRDKVVAEYALRGMSQSIGVSEFLHTITLPEKFKGSLPTIEELEAQLRALPDEEA